MSHAARCQDDACEVFHCRGCGGHCTYQVNGVTLNSVGNYCSRCERDRLSPSMWDHDGVRELLVLAGGCVFAFGWAWLAVYAPTATAMLIGAGLYADRGGLDFRFDFRVGSV